MRTEDEGEEMAPRVLLDPAGLEHRLAQGMLHLALTPQRELAVVHKAGGLPLAPGVLMGAIQVAARRARELETWLGWMCASTKTGRLNRSKCGKMMDDLRRS
jgi:hypothetical protein